MSLLIVLIVKNSHILAGICIIFLKNLLDQIWKAFNTILSKTNQVRQILAVFFAN